MHKATKMLLQSLLFLVSFCLGLWLFNHVNPWLGVCVCLIIVLLGFNRLVKWLNKISDDIKPKSE